MKKSEFSQVSIAFTPDQREWLEEKRAHGWNRSALVRQALEAYIAQWGKEDEDDDDFDAVCGGGQGYYNLVELPMVDEEGENNG